MTIRHTPKFPPHSGLYAALRLAADEAVSRGEQRDVFAIYAKIAIIAVATVGCYAAYLSFSGVMVMGLALPLGLLLAAIGFNIQHDGGQRVHRQ